MVLKAKDEFHSGLCRDPQACKVKFFTVVKPFVSGDDGVDDPLFLTGRVNDTILTFDLPFELHIGTPPDWTVDGSKGGMWAIYGMKVKILADQIKVLESGVAFMQRLSMTIHWGCVNSAAEGCKKMMCTLGQDIAVQMQPPPASCASSSAHGQPPASCASSSAHGQALQDIAVQIQPPTAYGCGWLAEAAEANPWSSMVDY